MRLPRGDYLRSIGRRDDARRIETPTKKTAVTIDQQIAAVDLEVELAVNADARRVWNAVAKTLRNAARATRKSAKDNAAGANREI